MQLFGLIGYPLTHSFSKGYFTAKFEELGLEDYRYNNYELDSIDLFPSLWKRNPELVGLNVTVPYKLEVIPFLDRLDQSATRVGAVNVIKREGNELVGYNSDYYGFKTSLIAGTPAGMQLRQALILGVGGAAKAVAVALEDLTIDFKTVSRTPGKGDYTYEDLNNDTSLITQADLLVNTTPLGMYPNLDTLPDLPYEVLHSEQYLYDLVYNPDVTAFLKAGKAVDAHIKNGLDMLHLQADRSWEIWNTQNGI